MTVADPRGKPGGVVTPFLVDRDIFASKGSHITIELVNFLLLKRERVAIMALVIKLLLFVALRVLRKYFNYRFQQGLRSQNIICN